MKTLILVSGWARNTLTYRQLTDIRPDGWNVMIVPYYQIIPTQNEDIENKLADILRQGHLDKIYLGGVSLGAEACIKFASRWPNKVETLFLIDSCGVKAQHPILQIIKSLFSLQTLRGMKRLKKDPSGLKDFTKKPLFYFKLILHYLHLDLEKELSAITVPTTIIWGEEDKLIPVEQGMKIHALIPHSQLVILENMDHSWISHDPQFFWKNIEQ